MEVQMECIVVALATTINEKQFDASYRLWS